MLRADEPCATRTRGAPLMPSRARPGPSRANRRGSPDVVEKRRAARHFNELLLGSSGRAARDGRTEKRRARLLEELGRGTTRTGRALKPIDVLSRIGDLLGLGEPLASIKKACPPPRAVAPTAEMLEGLKRLHRAYGFPIEAYRFVGFDEAALRRAGISARGPGPVSRRAARAPGASETRAGRRGAA
jgi:hypothetical protein